MKTYNISIENKLISGNMNIELSEQEVKDLIEQYNKPTHKRKYFVPKEDSKYWFIDDNATIYSDWYDNIIDNNNVDIRRTRLGNCFATEQDAQDELNRRQAIVRIWNNYDDKYHWDIDWDNRNQTKYSITYNHEGKIIERAGYSLVSQYSTELPYFKSAEDRNQFVEDNEKDLLIVFGIK